MTELRILSDLHLAHPASTVPQVSALFPLFEGVRGVCFNGDSMETCAAALERDARDKFAALTSYLDGLGIAVQALRGNHDPDVPGPAWRHLDAGDVLVTHGDVCFRYGSPWSPWVPAARPKLDLAELKHGGYDAIRTMEQRFELAADYARAFYPRARRFHGWAGKLETILHAAWPPTTPITILRIWLHGPDMVADWLEKFAPDTKVIIMGHTHRPGIWQRRGRWIVNTGAYHPMGLPKVVDHNAGRIDLRRVRKHKACYFPGEILHSLVRQRNGTWSMA